MIQTDSLLIFIKLFLKHLFQKQATERRETASGQWRFNAITSFVIDKDDRIALFPFPYFCSRKFQCE